MLMHIGIAQRGIVNVASSAQWPIKDDVPYVLDVAFTSAERAIIAAVSIDKSLPSYCKKLLLSILKC
jgi:hypothetical protein